jgi:hypothetical protein
VRGLLIAQQPGTQTVISAPTRRAWERDGPRLATTQVGWARRDQLTNAQLVALFGVLTRVVLSFDSMIRNHLAQANRYIAEMRADIARERVFLEHALDAGYPSEVAESMLHTLEGALRIFEMHRELVLDQLKRRPSE